VAAAVIVRYEGMHPTLCDKAAKDGAPGVSGGIARRAKVG
jgi:hypothetical protein